MKFLFVLFILSISVHCYSQPEKDSFNPLMRFLQSNFDSTVIFNNYSTWDVSPNYWIVSKVNNRIFYYTYQDNYSRPALQKQIDTLLKFFVPRKSKYKTTPPDLNEYFFPRPVIDSAAQIFWLELIRQNIWDLKDDHTDTARCANYCSSDADYYQFYLLINESCTKLEFYDVYNMAEHCRRSVYLNKAIQIIERFKTVFR